MKYLLDTNTCVQYLRHGVTSLVGTRMAIAKPGEVVLCSVVVGELNFGVLQSQNVAKNRADLEAFRAGLVSLPFDDLCAEEYAIVRTDLAAKGTPIGPNDLLIAAVALANGLILVTHNTGEFRRVVGLSLEDWQI